MAYNSAYTGSQVDAAVGAVRQKETKWDNKQDELTGTEDQLVGFNSAGEATAVAKPIYTATDVGAMSAVSGGTVGQVLTKTESSQEWQDAPDGLPSGGEEGQVLTKTASGAQWDDVPSDLPAGGTDGQILTKTADGVAWEDAPEGGVTSFNSRTGAIAPQAGDYTADMVGAIPTQTGTQGQVLGFTADNTVGAMDAPSGLPDGGTPGQMLYQGESGPEWGDKPVMYVTITGDEESGYSADKTCDELISAHNDGYALFAVIYVQNQHSYIASLYIVTDIPGAKNVQFCGALGSPFVSIYEESTTEVMVIFDTKISASKISFTPGTTGLTADNVQDAIEELNDKLPAISLASATLYSGSWTLSGGKYAQTVQISGMTSSARLVLPDPDTPGTDQQADEEVLQAWGAGPAKIEPSAGNGTVTFYSWTQPTINIPIQVVVIT